jgi:hypothetical protein
MILPGPPSLKPLVILLLLLAKQPTRIWAQLSTGAVAGLVQDASRANIPGAAVKLINTQTGSENFTSTRHDGSFVLDGVIPGVYTLQIERQGFATTQVRGIALSVGDLRNILVRMQVGRVTESVTVDASGMTLNTTDATVSTLVDRKLAEAVPLNGENFQDLIALTPGIVTQSPQAAVGRVQTQGEFSVNGQSPEANAFFVDGISADTNGGGPRNPARTVGTGSAAGATALGTTQSLVPVEALQQFRVLTSSYSAEYGRSPGGQFTFLTRAGDNTTHGGIFYNFRSNVFDAIDWFAQHAPYGNLLSGGTRFSQNDFGGSFGAPLTLPRLYQGRDRTFFFAAFEGLYVPQPTPQSYYYGVAFPFPYQAFNIYPQLLQFLPSANYSEVLPAADGQPSGLGQVSMSAYALPAHLNSGSFRIDHTISPKLALFFRFGDSPSVSETQQLNTSSNNHLGNRTFSLGASGQMWSHLSNELRVGFVNESSNTISTTRENYAFADTPPMYTLDQALGIPANEKNVSSDVYIRVSGVGDSEAYTNVSSGSLLQWNLRDTFLLEHGPHLFKFGVDQRHIRSNLLPPALTVAADLFSGDAIYNNSVSGLVITRASPAHPTQEQFALFGQDEWKIADNLTLSLGLRWELDPPPRGRNDEDAFTISGNVTAPATLGVELRGTPLWHIPTFNVAPRAGLAWTLDDRPGSELILRAGAGVFFDGSNRAALPAFSALGFANSSYYANVPLPATSSQLAVPQPGTSPFQGTNGFAFPAHLQLPYSWQWNVSIERAFGRDQTLTASYVGSSGRRLEQEQRRNVTAVNPQFGDITFFPGGLSSSYESMQIKFQRNIAQGLQGLASYTWAHTLDWGSTDPAFSLVRGNSDLDVRHNLELAAAWDFPRPRAGWIVRNLFGGWRLDGRVLARTAFPVTLEGNTFLDPVTGAVYFSGVDRILGKPLYRYGDSFPGRRIFNGGASVTDPAFLLPQASDPGNAPRNLLRGFAALQGNVGIRRNFQLHNALHLQFGMDMFNVTNHPNFGYINPNLPDLLFGQSTRLLYQSFGNSGSLYQQGAPRSAQISVHLTF